MNKFSYNIGFSKVCLMWTYNRKMKFLKQYLLLSFALHECNFNELFEEYQVVMN